MRSLLNIWWLGLKELRSLCSDLVMVLFVAYAFTMAIYVQATGTSNEVNNASIAFVDEDDSALSLEMMNAFYPPRFQRPALIAAEDVEDAMDRGRFMFVVDIPPEFENDLRAQRQPEIQLNIQGSVPITSRTSSMTASPASCVAKTRSTTNRSVWSSAKCSTPTAPRRGSRASSRSSTKSHS
jgi:hypothetical protein